MSDQFVGEVRMFGGNFAPRGWAFCNGQLLSIASFTTLYALIGTTYGGDGQTTFALPDLQCRLPIHQGQGQGLSARTMGEKAGVEAVTLTIGEMPRHGHPLFATTNPGSLPGPENGVPATPAGGPTTSSLYVVPGDSVLVPAAMAVSSVAPDGNSLPHSNMMPSLSVSFIIALEGIFPSRN